MTMEEMQRLLERQQSRTDIMNLMGRYQYYHTGGQMSRIGPGANTARWACSAQRNRWNFSMP